jgi:hypothetical protein
MFLPNLEKEKKFIQTSFYLSESSFTYPMLWLSGLARRLQSECKSWSQGGSAKTGFIVLTL